MKSVGSDDVALCHAADGHSLVIAKLLMLPVARQALCLRSWLAAEGVRPPSKVRLFEALRQVRETHNDRSAVTAAKSAAGARTSFCVTAIL